MDLYQFLVQMAEFVKLTKENMNGDLIKMMIRHALFLKSEYLNLWILTT